MENKNKEIIVPSGQGEDKSPYESDSKFSGYVSYLTELRKDGEDLILALNNEIHDIKLNEQIDKETKEKLIAADKEKIESAKKVKESNKDKVKELITKAITESTEVWKPYYTKIKTEEDEKIVKAKNYFQQEQARELVAHQERLNVIKAKTNPNPSDEKKFKETIKVETKAESILYKSHVEQARSARDFMIQKAKDTKNAAYMEKYGYANRVRNNHHSIAEAFEFKWRNYLYTFNVKDYFLRNALYYIILICFIFFVAKSNGNLLSGDNIIGILSQSSVKLFFSLGVAGLILIAGTDLSVGRMTGMGVTIACMVMSDQIYEDKFGHTIMNLLGVPMGVRLIIALLLCIVFCVLFSSIAGFFTAKFKMHPFITTLSTQLLMFGFFMFLLSNNATFKMNSEIKSGIIGTQGWLLIVYAVIATAVVWFIWNKTKFGKYMYAVGGNPEAASVSGINVFKVTMGIFIMAGVLYGIGGFLTGAQVGSGNPASGYGTELDAIAACVVGGISFSGGIGKIKGAVIGTLIFTGLTYCLTNLGYDPNIQYIFKGAIIMAAVCLDSLKYLKKK